MHGLGGIAQPAGLLLPGLPLTRLGKIGVGGERDKRSSRRGTCAGGAGSEAVGTRPASRAALACLKARAGGAMCVSQHTVPHRP